MLGGAIPGLGIIAYIRNQDEQGMMSKPVNSILHDLCIRFLSPGSCFV